jgi:hypothetical protein
MVGGQLCNDSVFKQCPQKDSKMNGQVFISYARSTALDAARAVRAALEAIQIPVFLDERDIAPGDAFPQDLADALLKTRVVLVFADETYFERPWCVYEYRVAVAPSRAANANADAPLPHVVIALPASGGMERIAAHLPPILATRSCLGPINRISWPPWFGKR